MFRVSGGGAKKKAEERKRRRKQSLMASESEKPVLNVCSSIPKSLFYDSSLPH